MRGGERAIDGVAAAWRAYVGFAQRLELDHLLLVLASQRRNVVFRLLVASLELSERDLQLMMVVRVGTRDSIGHRLVFFLVLLANLLTLPSTVLTAQCT